MEKLSFVKACQDFFTKPPHGKKIEISEFKELDSGRQARDPRDVDRGGVRRPRDRRGRTHELRWELTEQGRQLRWLVEKT